MQPDNDLFEVDFFQEGVDQIDPVGLFMVMGRQSVGFIKSAVVLFDCFPVSQRFKRVIFVRCETTVTFVPTNLRFGSKSARVGFSLSV